MVEAQGTIIMGGKRYITVLFFRDEIREMTADLASDDYEWEVGALDVPGVPFKGVYAIGSPTRAQASAG